MTEYIRGPIVIEGDTMSETTDALEQMECGVDELAPEPLEQLAPDRQLMLKTLQAISECRCRFRADPLDHARMAAVYCQRLASEALNNNEEAVDRVIEEGDGTI